MSVINFRKAPRGKFRITFIGWNDRERVQCDCESLEDAKDVADALTPRWTYSYVYNDRADIVYEGRRPVYLSLH